MAPVRNRLSTKGVQNAKPPAGKTPRYVLDGGGLYLQIAHTGSKSWVYRFSLNGRERFMGLGSAALVSLAGAREAATDCRRMRSKGVDPIEQRKARRVEDQATATTFDDCSAAYIEAHKAGWRNAKHAAQWARTLKTYASPVFGSLPVQAVDRDLVLKVLEPICRTKPETASRLRGRIESILDWARVRGFRTGENPARW